MVTQYNIEKFVIDELFLPYKELILINPTPANIKRYIAELNAAPETILNDLKRDRHVYSLVYGRLAEKDICFYKYIVHPVADEVTKTVKSIRLKKHILEVQGKDVPYKDIAAEHLTKEIKTKQPKTDDKKRKSIKRQSGKTHYNIENFVINELFTPCKAFLLDDPTPDNIKSYEKALMKKPELILSDIRGNVEAFTLAYRRLAETNFRFYKHLVHPVVDEVNEIVAAIREEKDVYPEREYADIAADYYRKNVEKG